MAYMIRMAIKKDQFVLITTNALGVYTFEHTQFLQLKRFINVLILPCLNIKLSMGVPGLYCSIACF